MMKLTLGCFFFFLFHLGCSNGVDLGREVGVRFENQSQFTVEALYVHSNPLDYASSVNRLEEYLEPGEEFSSTIRNNDWYVTVYRRPNQDSDVLAYKTATTWEPEIYPNIIYFDEQFRFSE